MCRVHVNVCFDFGFDPAAKDAAAGKNNCTHAVCVNNCQF
jgi:hypothetical protein